jgi:signal recognition particle receptor subunit beta
MVELNHRDRTIKVKLVYYGPPLGGKTTNLQILHHRAESRRRGELISVNSAQDRTILFDLLPLKTPGFRGFDLRLQVLAVPGQAMYAATRRLVLKGADSLVFVANSALDRWEENLQSYREMTQNLLSHHLDPAQMPLVLQYNKRDLPQVLEPEALDRGLNSRNTDAIPAVAIRGEGVLETFIAALALTAQDLAQRYAILDVKQGRPARQWAADTVKDLFGATHLSFEPDPALMMEGAPSAGPSSGPWAAPVTAAPTPPAGARPGRAAVEGYTVVRVAPPPHAATDEGARPSRTSPDARSTELVETYAEASAQLGAALAELREERDAARHRLADLRHTMEAAQRILSGVPLEAALEPVLEKMAGIAGTDHAAFWVPQPGSPPRTAALRGLSCDPLLEASPAARYVLDHVGLGQQPSFVYGADNLDLGQALDGEERRFVAALAVPFRTPAGLQGLALFYYDADTAQPGAGVLEHLAEIPRALAAALELAATLHTVKAAERALELALTGTASLKGLEDVVRSMEALRDGLGGIRNRPDAPSWFVEEFTDLAPALSAALADGRSLLAFAEGKINRESVYVEDLLSELHTPEVTSQLDPRVETVLADATLLRVALRAMADELRARAGANTVAIAIRTRSDGDKVRVTLRLASAAPEPPPGGTVNAGIGLGLARRIAELHGGALDESAGQLTLALPTS